MSVSIYALKPRFQGLLRPGVRQLARLGVTANQVTTLACLVSVALGLTLYLAPLPPAAFALVPLWLLLRMALNAIDGMLAREHGQQSVLGAYLNELTDVLADAALYLPLAKVAPFSPLWIGVIVLAAALSEMAGALGQTVGAGRRYDGPMGKSDRAAVFGALGLAVALLAGPEGLPAAWHGLAWVLPAVAALTGVSVVNRVRAGLPAR
ncbi:MAG: hypothetical protein RI907_1506 [Pseudomonadota bacterium]|jgi:CDP-diacylglycerol--glycerol-3-phosphate 3-phosphatidyltransferase